jgi:hypothetical protein
MRFRFKLLAVLIGVPAVLVAVAAVMVPRLVDSEEYKREVVALVRAHTGHELRIDGNARLHVLPALSLTVTDVGLANPAGFSAGDIARLPWLKVELEPLPLLAGRVEPRAITVTGLVVHLERDADGRGNWENSGAADQDGGAASTDAADAALAALAIGELDIRDAAFQWRGPAGGEAFEVSGINLRTGALRGGEGIEDVRLQGTLPESGVVVEARGDVTLAGGGRDLAVPKLEVTFSAPSLSGLRVDGTLETALTAKLPEGRLFLSGARASARGSGSDGRRLQVDLAGDLGIDAAEGRLMESTLSLVVPGYALPGMEGDLSVQGILSGDLVSGAYTFHGMQGDGHIEGTAAGSPQIAFTMAGTVEGDLDTRKLAAPGLVLAGGVDGDRLPFEFGGDLEFSGKARTLTAANMDLRLDDWVMDGAMTLRTTPSPRGMQGVLDVRIQGRPLAGSFAVVASALHADAMDVRANVVADLDIATDAIALRGPSAIVLRADVTPGDGKRPWRVGSLELGARVKDAALPDGELTVKLGADLDVDLKKESVHTDNLRMTVDDSHIEGTVRVSGFDAPAIRVDLQADAIDADRLRLPVAAPVDGSTRAKSMKTPLEAIRALDFAGEVRIEKLTVNGVMMENVRLTSGAGDKGG